MAEGTVPFGLDGTEDEIDLTAGDARALRDTLARRVAVPPGGQAAAGGRDGLDAGRR